ncbi:MAG: MmgE/PrpD family protein [Pseudomonadota bacterium]
MTSFSVAFAEWAATATFPDTAREEARLALLDTVGCIIAGWDEPQTDAARRAFAAEDTTTAAALILGTAAHVLDFDDYELPGSTHPSAALLGALLALARGAPVPMGDLLDAYAAGFEAIVRLGEWLRYDHYNAGWHATGTLGTVGAASASARRRGLDAPAFAHALAISASLAGGLKAQFGTDTKALHPGLAARAGIEAARLAAAGVTGAPDAFEGRFGFAALHHGAADAPGDTLAKIGQPLGISEHAILRKPWPSCAYTHRVIDAALAVRPHLPASADWERMTLRIPEPFFRVASVLQPMSANEARFSATYTALLALLYGAVCPQDFRDEAWLRPEIVDLLTRVDVDAYDPGPALSDMSPDHPDRVTVHVGDGATLSETVGHVSGGPNRPMSVGDLRAKFFACGGDETTADLIQTASLATRITIGDCATHFELTKYEGKT